MGKINKGIATFIIFLSLVTIWGLFTREPADMIKQTQIPEVKPEVAGFIIQFEDGTTEPEVKAILDNGSLTLNYSIDYNWDNGGYKYYIKVNKDKKMDIVNELKKDENWTDPVLNGFKKGDYYIIPTTEQAT